MNDLRRAMTSVDEDIDRIGMAAVSAALVIQHGPDPREDEARQKAEAEAEKQRGFDSALADVVELVARHRGRLGRKTCSQHDGQVIRRIFDLVRSLHPGGEE